MNTPAPAPTPAPTESLPPVSKALGPVTTFHLVNVPPADAQFVGNVIALFTDPTYEWYCNQLRERKLVIIYEPDGGLTTVPTPEPTPNGFKR